jgi:hypothetical protein
MRIIEFEEIISGETPQLFGASLYEKKFLVYYGKFFRKKFSYCGGGQKPMNVYLVFLLLLEHIY